MQQHVAQDSTSEKLAPLHRYVMTTQATWERGAVQYVDIKIKRNVRQWVRDLRARMGGGGREKKVHRPGARTQCHSSGNLSEMGHYELKAASSRFFSPSPPFAARHGKTRPVSRELKRDETRLSRKRDRLTSSWTAAVKTPASGPGAPSELS